MTTSVAAKNSYSTHEAVLNLATRLIACPSITPRESGCMAIIEECLRRMDFSIEYIHRGDVTNLWAQRGNDRPLFCFAGHVDVVPTGPKEQWESPPFEPEQRDGFLYGRGAADMKSSIAAFITAVETFVDAMPNHRGSIAVLLTSDEEGEAIDGTTAVVEMLRSRGVTMDYCLVGEPTATKKLGDMVKNGRRGSLTGMLTIKGIQGHVGYPSLARNPIHLAAPAITELTVTEWDQGNQFFPPTTWQVSNIHAGTGASNVIPGHMDVLFNFRFSTASTPEQLQARLCAILDRHELDYDISWVLGASPYLTKKGELVSVVCQAIRDELGIETELSTEGGVSDGRFIAEICPQVIEVGPVNASVHKINECIEIAALSQLVAVYRRILERLLS